MKSKALKITQIHVRDKHLCLIRPHSKFTVNVFHLGSQGQVNRLDHSRLRWLIAKTTISFINKWLSRHLLPNSRLRKINGSFNY